MNQLKFSCVLMTLLLTTALAYAQNVATQPTSTPATTRAKEDPTQPIIKPGQHFIDMHQRFLTRKSQGPIEVLFLGDSITEGWSGQGKSVWEKEYANLAAANFGIGGDRTQHVLWRIANGELDGLHPQAVVLLIGTNNVGPDSAEQIIAADTKIVQQILDKTGSKVLLLGVFPRHSRFDSPQTMPEIRAINAGLSKLDNGATVRYLDISDHFLAADGNVIPETMYDGLHPNTRGYQLWADAMRPLFSEMVKRPTTQPMN